MKVIDPTGVELSPGEREKCLGNGEHVDDKGRAIECCCDECDYFLLCCPEWNDVDAAYAEENNVTTTENGRAEKMTIEECTKEELLYVIKYLTRADKRSLVSALNAVKYQRAEKKIAEAERWAQVANDNRIRYIELAEKHSGQRVIDLPADDIIEMNTCLENAEKADKKYDKLMKEANCLWNINSHKT